MTPLWLATLHCRCGATVAARHRTCPRLALCAAQLVALGEDWTRLDADRGCCPRCDEDAWIEDLVRATQWVPRAMHA